MAPWVGLDPGGRGCRRGTLCLRQPKTPSSEPDSRQQKVGSTVTRKGSTRKVVSLLLALLAVSAIGLAAAESASASDINWGAGSSEWGFVPI